MIARLLAFLIILYALGFALFAVTLGIGLLMGRSFIAIMFDQMFNLTPEGWRLLTIRWMVFFAGMAVLNEIIWRTQSTDFWVSFKAFGVIPITAVFAMLQLRPHLLRSGSQAHAVLSLQEDSVLYAR